MSNHHFERDEGATLDVLPPDLEALHRHLEEDAAAWLVQESAGIQRLGEHLRAQASEMAGEPSSGTHQRRPQQNTMTFDTEEPRIAMPRAAPSHARWRGFAAAGATLAIVAALAGLFLHMAPGHGPSSTPLKPTYQDAHGRWADLSGLDYRTTWGANDVPAISPSNPDVVYETSAYGFSGSYDAEGVATLQRTDDDGVTWHKLAVPVPANHVDHAGIQVSPANPHTAFLTILDNYGQDCPPGTSQPDTEAGSGSLCWLEYSTTDGGQHWVITRLPLAGGSTTGVLQNVSAQGTRLYATFRCSNWQCLRLVVSTDGGVSWQFADSTLLSPAGNVCDWAAASSGSALFAVTSPLQCDTRNQVPLTLWRSEDGGQHWARVGNLPIPNERSMSVVSTPGGAQPLLYMLMPRTLSVSTDKEGGKYLTFSSSPSDLKVSDDGGKTWHDAPSQGIPGGQTPAFSDGLFGLSGPLSDGSVILVTFSVAGPPGVAVTSSTSLYAWKHGDTAWRLIAPPLNGELGGLLVTPSPSSPQGILWAILQNRNARAGTPIAFHAPPDSRVPTPDLSGYTANAFTFFRYQP